MPEPLSQNITGYLNSLYGNQSAEEYVKFISKKPSQYLRVNTLKINRGLLAEKLSSKYSIKTEAIPGVNNALKVLNGTELAGKTVEHILGYYYIQGLSSMLPAIALAPTYKDITLDLCSAPGSKSTQMSEMMQNRGTLILNEVQLKRVKGLVHNIDRMNLVNAGVIHSKGENLSKNYSNYFDKILVDVPCSGLGIIQKKGEVNDWWSENRVERLQQLQIRLLISAVKMLRVGGEIVYSTCTLTPEENEYVIDKIIKRYPVEIIPCELPVKSRNGFTEYDGTEFNKELAEAKRIIPWETDTDGFFITKLVKTEATESPDKHVTTLKKIRMIESTHHELRSHLLRLCSYFGIKENVFNDYNFIFKGNDIFFINSDWRDEHPGNFDRIGIKFGAIDKHDNIILHTNAAQLINENITENIYQIKNQNELTTYLEGGTIKTGSYIPGQCVLMYEGYIIGTAVRTDSGIKSRFPRSKRTQQIYTDF